MRPAIPEDLPNLTQADWFQIIPAMGRANRAVAEYNGMLRRLPNTSLLLAPLRLQEAVLSSRIEGTLATMSEVLQFEAGQLPQKESRRQDIEEILNYRSALDAAVDELKTRPFNRSLLLKLHRILLTSARGHNKAPGEFRRQQNFVGSRVGGVEKIRFTPPDWTKLDHSLSNWEKYYHCDDDPLVRLALIHAQFEFLHPFLDGNGRIGRILIPIFLFEKGLLSEPTFYMSEYIEEHRDEYIERLNELGRVKNSWRSWVQFFLEAIASQAERNVNTADAILHLYEQLKQQFMDATKSRYAIALLDAAFQLQYFQASQLQWKGDKPSRPTVLSMLHALEHRGLVSVYRGGSGRRSSIWRLPELTALIEKKP
jgi:Fic family protein